MTICRLCTFSFSIDSGFVKQNEEISAFFLAKTSTHPTLWPDCLTLQAEMVSSDDWWWRRGGGGRDVRIASIGGCGIYKHSTVSVQCILYSKQIYIWQEERGTREWIIIILHWIQNGSLSKPLLFFAANSLPCFMWCWPYNIRCCFQVEKMWLLINIYIL